MQAMQLFTTEMRRLTSSCSRSKRHGCVKSNSDVNRYSELYFKSTVFCHCKKTVPIVI